VDAGLVTDLRGEAENELAVICRVGGLPEPIRQRLTREIQDALKKAVPQLEKVRVEWQADPAPQAANGPAVSGEPGPPRIRHVVAVGSGKGGVGKSTIAASIAYALKHRGLRVGLMDSDVYGPSIPHMLGIKGGANVINEPTLRILPPRPTASKSSRWASSSRPTGRSLARPDAAQSGEGLPLRRRMGRTRLPRRRPSARHRGHHPQPFAADAISGGVIVCTPQDVALLDAKKALDMLRTVKIPCRGVVENMSFFECPGCGKRSEIFGSGGAKRWAEQEGVPFLGSVPINLQVRINGDEGICGTTSPTPIRYATT